MIAQNRSIMHAHDSRGYTPLHAACISTHDEGPDIVDLILDVASRFNTSLQQFQFELGFPEIFAALGRQV